MKRVLCLYRVSTKGQVDNKDDIPMQRRECMDFIDRQDDWVFVGERMEKGVSGYKVSAANRDAIIEIREMAEKKQFDVLLVFMFDRLGRKEDETPFLVKWFIEHGIEVWSTREGEQKLDNQVDRLLNFMRYWAASGESEKTSIRVKAAHTQMTADGLWRGGNCPYGYKLVHKGRVGKKNRQLYDLEIDEVTAPIVMEIFDLICKQGYGTLRAANYLNAKYPDPNKVWTAQTIRNMIRNPIYGGRMHMNDTLSEPIESLRLATDEQIEFGKYAIAKRIPHKYVTEREAENMEVPEGSTKASVFGASVLSGILYCGHCGKRLIGGYHTRQLASHPYHRPIYRCYNGAVKAKQCDGLTVYSAIKIESAVMEVVYNYFSQMKETVDDVWRDDARKTLRNGVKARERAAVSKLEQLSRDQDGLKKEIMKSINGTSSFDTDLLKEMLAENKAAQLAAEQEITQLREEKDKEEEKLKHLSLQYQNIKNWADEFSEASVDTKKMILAKMIEKITVTRDYDITIKFYVTPADFYGGDQEIRLTSIADRSAC
ncbi:MAG: recombinase family protein [Oscillospiraceae bacterium]|nr:recombinase family protein [Oscillospiraceae bacterium]